MNGGLWWWVGVIKGHNTSRHIMINFPLPSHRNVIAYVGHPYGAPLISGRSYLWISIEKTESRCAIKWYFLNVKWLGIMPLWNKSQRIISGSLCGLSPAMNSPITHPPSTPLGKWLLPADVILFFEGQIPASFPLEACHEGFLSLHHLCINFPDTIPLIYWSIFCRACCSCFKSKTSKIPFHQLLMSYFTRFFFIQKVLHIYPNYPLLTNNRVENIWHVLFSQES